MKLLIAEDDVTSLMILKRILTRWGYDVTTADDGAKAWGEMQQPDPPPLVLLDWMMPEMDGLEVCRKIRGMERPEDHPFYIILLTGRTTKADIVAGLEAGADDYITKPFDTNELKARVAVGRRVVDLQLQVATHVKELEDALEHIKTLQGILPICSYCKKIRDDHNYWQQVDTYISRTTGARFSHSICPDCYETQVRPQLKTLEEGKD